jgi:hypothetical protein
MTLKRSQLRECARLALERRGFSVEPIRGSGILPGARLRAKKGAVTRNIAVRTSLDREVGLTRKSDGDWSTIPRMDEVLVAVPSDDERSSVEILSFAPKVLIRAFDKALKVRQGENPDFKLKSPIFIALDEVVHGGAASEQALKAMSQWSSLVPLTAVSRPHVSEAVSRPHVSENESESEFFDRVRQEFAERHGFDPSKVRVEFSVTS